MSQKIIEKKIKNGEFTFDALAIDTSPNPEFLGGQYELKWQIKGDLKKRIKEAAVSLVSEEVEPLETKPQTIKVRIEVKVWEEEPEKEAQE